MTVPFRQVHLDFHTNGNIPGVGAKFDKREFQDALQRADVNSITCFSKCHHGWSYHDTTVGKRHPHMADELLPRQIDACREIGVRVPIYLSAGFDELALLEHPEWRVIDRRGVGMEPFHVGWRGMPRWNSPYLDYLCRQIEEVVTRWRDADGIFLDIVGPRLDYSDQSLLQMRDAGLDPENEDEVVAWADTVLLEYYEKTTAAARIHNPDLPVFHNGGHVHVGAQEQLRYNSHLELESLPTGGYDYDHFPFSARYAITTGKEFLGMTGKFHTMWGEFGGFKRPEALQYECETMLSLGAKCSIGEQLHPSGAINQDSWSLIGSAYHVVSEKEPWCSDVIPHARIGLVSAGRRQARNAHCDEGAARMLQELHLPFLVLDSHAEWARFELIILPDSITMNTALARKAMDYIEQGGRIVASGSSLLDEQRGDIVLSKAGIRKLGEGKFDPDYLVATSLCAGVSVMSPVVIHGGALEIEPLQGTSVLVERTVPYFNRTWEHFCSHLHAPDQPATSAEEKPTPSATISPEGNVAYFAHNIFTRYRLYGQPLYRDFVFSAIRILFGGDDRLPVRTEGLPAAGRVNLMEQPTQQRYVLHVTYGSPSLRGASASEGPNACPVEVIEDIPSIFNVRCTVRLPRPIRSARLVPENVDLPFTQYDDSVAIVIPEIHRHRMIELGW
jgi:hypothetical protein